MVQNEPDCTLDRIVEADESIDAAKPLPPDRNTFQRELSRINNDISRMRHEVERLVDRNGNVGLISAARLRKDSIRSQREQLAKEADVVKVQIADLRKEIDVLRNSQFELEKDCRVRSFEKIDSYIKTNEDRYRTKNLNRKDEQLVVSEIDALKRNRAKLEKLDEVLKERSVIDQKISVLRKKNEETYRHILKLKSQQMAANNERRCHVEHLLGIRRDLTELYAQRGELIGTYNKERFDYGEWMKKNRRKAIAGSNSYPATFPSVHRTRNTSVCLEDEELEPFYEQKRDCKRLIAYLERLQANMEKSDLTEQEMAHCVLDSGSDSAEEFPASFARLTVAPPSNGLKKFPTTRKTHIRKAKPTQPLSHMFEVYNLFGSVEVDVAVTYQDVPRILQDVRNRLSFFEGETNIIDWDEELKGLGTYLTVSRTMSEFTGDSACPDSASESASLVSGRHRRSSIESPQRNPSTTDEGLWSRESQSAVPPIVSIASFTDMDEL